MEGQLMALAIETYKVTLIISLPILITGLVIGLLVSIFQATTQINEMTLSFVPKILGVIAVIIFTMPWMLNMLTALSNGSYQEVEEKSADDDSMEHFKTIMRQHGVNIPDLESHKVTKDGIDITYYSKYARTAFFVDEPPEYAVSSLKRKGIRSVIIGPEKEWAETVAEAASTLEDL